ncbi:hypothetical protein Tco_0782106 [Tanacetum coccineum]
MSAMANTTPIVTTVTKPATKEKTPKETDAAPRVNILDFCEEHYEDILPVIMDKIRRDKRKEVHTRLDFGDNTKRSRRIREGSQNSSAGTLSARYRNPSERPKVRDRLKDNDGNVFGRLGHRRQSAFDRHSDTYSPSTTKFGSDRASSRDHYHSRGHPHRRDSSLSRDRPRSRDRSPGIKESYGNTCSSYRTGARHGYHSRDRDRPRIMKRGRHKPTDEDDLAVPWSCEEVDPFTPRIRNFKSSRKTRMPNNVKAYDGTGDPKDHVKKFQAAAQEKCRRFQKEGSRAVEPTGSRPKRMLPERNLMFHRVKKQIKEFVRAGKLSHLIKEIKQGRDQTKVGKKEAPAKDKSLVHSISTIHGLGGMGTKAGKLRKDSKLCPCQQNYVPTTHYHQGYRRSACYRSGNWRTHDPPHLCRRGFLNGSALRALLQPAPTGNQKPNGETIWPLGQLRLLVTIGDADHSTKAWMNFMIIRSLSPYNGIIGRPGIREI